MQGKGRITDRRFRKEIYLSTEYPNTVILNYIGEEKRFTTKAHDNSLRQTKITIRTKPLVTEKKL